ncbi:MAG: hypothetical protein WA001_02060, partial [Patescibacteria group bacterium]
VVFARADTADRLETKSIDQRTQSLKDGMTLSLAHPVFGSGPNAELIDLRNVDAKQAGKPAAGFKAPEPLEPPADAYLLAFVDLGIVGTLLVIAFLAQTIRRIPRSAWPFLLLFGVLAAFDYYLWSTWSGMCLALILLLLLQNFFGTDKA